MRLPSLVFFVFPFPMISVGNSRKKLGRDKVRHDVSHGIAKFLNKPFSLAQTDGKIMQVIQ